MSKITGMKPYLSMWTHPRSTIRAIIDADPKSNIRYGILYLVTIFALQNMLFYANWWSIGTQISSSTILIAGIFLSPFVGMAWVYIAGWIFYFTGRWLHGHAPASHLRSALAWSKIPVSINLLTWLVFIILDPKMAFVLNGGLPSAILLNAINLFTGIWSFILLVQAVREIQKFTIGRALINIVMGWVIYFLVVMIFIISFRYIYLISV